MSGFDLGFGFDSIDGTDWKSEFEQAKKHIDDLVKHHKVFEAVQYIMTVFFGLMSDFTENYRLAKQADIMDALSKLQDIRNKIEQDIDACKDKGDTAAAKDAIKEYDKFKSLLDKYTKSADNPNGIFTKDQAKDLLKEFSNPDAPGGSIFQTGDDPDSLDPSKLAEKWHKLWNGDDPDNPSPNIQGVTNALTAVSTTLSSQSSIAQSKTKYFETWDEQFLSIQHSGMSNYMSQEKTPNSHMQSASG